MSREAAHNGSRYKSDWVDLLSIDLTPEYDNFRIQR